MTRRLALPVLILFLAACAALTPPAPRNTAEAIAQAHVLIQETTDGVSRALDTQSVTKAQAAKMLTQLEQAEDHLVTARQVLSSGDPQTAQGQLDLAQALILVVRDGLGGAK